MELRSFIDSTYLKTPLEAGLSAGAHREVVVERVREAIELRFKAIILRPGYVSLARARVDEAQCDLQVGSVVDFPRGIAPLTKKLQEADRLIREGADELDFVVDYQAYKRGAGDRVKEAVYQATRRCLNAGKVCKWILETAALTEEQIQQLTLVIRDVIVANFGRNAASQVFVKSSTAYYPTPEGVPNGATERDIKIMMAHASPLKVKASGGIRSREQALRYLRLGVQRIGTSCAASLVCGAQSEER